MTDLITHNKEHVETLFQLLGTKENDITCSIAWVMKECPQFLRLFVSACSAHEIDADNTVILYQQHEKTGKRNGYTDLEITDFANVHIILEAKRGWRLPESDQLEKYANRPSFLRSTAADKRIVTVSECSKTYADSYLPFKTTANGTAVSHVSWKDLCCLAMEARKDSNNEQKRWIDDFIRYLGGLMTMQNKNSNKVYVVSLGKNKIKGTALTTRILAKKMGRYFCPAGCKGWPKVPPNYIAFRYDKKLQAIHHIDDYTVTRNIHDVIAEMPDEIQPYDCFVYELGPAIIPTKEVITGDGIPRDTRVWADIDLLLTCDTIRAARDKTKEREQTQDQQA